MKNNTFSDTIIPFVSKTALVLASGLFLVSCGIQSGYTETDGIYYDPATDKIERKIAWQEPDYYDMDETGAEKARESLPAPTGELTQEHRIISIMTIILLGVILITAIFIRRIILGIIIRTSVTLALQDGD